MLLRGLRAGLLAVSPFILMWSLTAPIASRGLLLALDSFYPRLSADDCPHADGIVVLSGDGPPRRYPPGPGDFPSRSETGLALYRNSCAPYLLFTDGGREGAQSRAAAIRGGVPPGDVLLLTKAIDTSDEARLAVDRSKDMGWNRLILVTSSYHMGRAKLLFEHAAAQSYPPLKIIPFPAGSGKELCCAAGWRDYLPSYRGFEHSSRAGRELLGQCLCRIGIC